MPAPAPLVSVIVVCRNPGPGLARALESVWRQEGATAELVVIDGASTDGTREWLEAQRERIAALVSEPDHGVYDAMNKGWDAATGDWILFLGADDRLAHPGVIAAATAALAGIPDGVATGEAVYDDGRRYRLAADPQPVRRNFVHHQASFYRRELRTVAGGFDPGLRIMGDYDFNLRLWRRGIPFRPLPLHVSDCGRGGLSDAGGWTGYREEIAVRHRHFPFLRCWPWDVGSVARYLRKRLVRAGRPR
ncbi:MAG: glycosyltransferase [Opitutaceae bacterium]|nr:glycosyltransferase [Opitutaceae bacterium]